LYHFFSICFVMTDVFLLGSLDYFNKTPAFILAQGSGFHNTDGVANVAFILLVVSHKLGRLLDKLPIQRMFNLAFHLDDDGFIHLVAHHNTNSFFS